MSKIRIDPVFEDEVDNLIFSALREFDRAEQLLRERYEAAKGQGDPATMEYILQKQTFMYSMRKDAEAAKIAYAVWEEMTSNPAFVKSSYAFFLFHNSHEYDAAITKVEEVESIVKRAEPEVSSAQVRSLIQALQIKGRALLRVGRVLDVPSVLRQINYQLTRHEAVEYGFEMDLCEECVNAEIGLSECNAYLEKATWTGLDRQSFEERRALCMKKLRAASGEDSGS